MNEDLIGNLLKVKLPFEPSYPAQVAGLIAIDDIKYLKKTLDLNREGMKFISSSLMKLNYKFIVSAANFITLILQTPLQAQFLCSELLKKGVIIRHLKGFGWPECVRVSIGTMEENQFFIENLKLI